MFYHRFSIGIFKMADTTFLVAAESTQTDLCNPSPCGPNAICNDGICSCMPDYYGDSTIGCRPECVLNNDCPRNKACVRNKCENPCVGACAPDAICDVVNHVPMCSCSPGFEGNAFAFCRPAIGTLSCWKEFSVSLVYKSRPFIYLNKLFS